MAEITINDALKRGVEAHKAGKIQEADRFYTAILKVQPKHPDANHNLGVLAVGIGKTEQGLTFFETALEANPSIAQFWLSYIDALIKLGKTDDAMNVLNQAKARGLETAGFDQLEKELNSTDSEDIKEPTQEALQPIIILYSQGLFQRVLEQVAHLRQQYPRSVTLCNIEGAAHSGLRQFDKAIDSYKRAIKVKPDYAEAYNNMGVAQKAQGDFQAAAGSYRQAIKVKPDYAEAYNNLGNTLKEQGDFQASIDSYSQALRNKPDYAEAYINMGIALKEQGDLQASIDSYRQAIKVKPDYAEAYINMGVALKEQGDFQASIDSYRQALRIKPDYAEVYNNMGVALKAQGNFNAALDSYRQALKIKPDYAEAYNNMGFVLYIQGDFAAAIDGYKQALKKKPDFAEAYYNMGIAWKDQGDFGAAISSFENAIRLRPDHAEAYYNLGIARTEKGDLDAAIASFEHALKIKPDYAEAYYNMGVAWTDKGDLNKAMEIMDMALTKTPDDLPIIRALLNILRYPLPYSNLVDNKYVDAQNELAKISIKNDEFKFIPDETIQQLYLSCEDILASYNLNLGTNIWQFYRGADFVQNCRRHMKVFNKFNIIPKDCHDCYKVSIKLRTVMELFKLMIVFDNLELEADNTRKCIVEVRPEITGTYTGLIFCLGLNEANKIMGIVKPIIEMRISKNIPVHVKRGCSEYALAYPEYSKIQKNESLMVPYNKDWCIYEEKIDKNLGGTNTHLRPNTKTLIHSRFVLYDVLVMRTWLAYAATIGDDSYLNISKAPVPIIKHLNRPRFS